MEMTGNTEIKRSATESFRNRFAFFLLFLLSIPAFSQTTTKNDGANTTTSSAVKKTKILIVPWEPKMFNCSSDISRAINKETGQNYNQIQEALRKGMVEQLKKSFGGTYSVISLIDDTAKMKEDLHYAYTCSTISNTPVNFPLNPTKADSAKLKTTPGVQKGQIQTTEDETDKFMNTVVLSPNMLGYLKKKYGADYVIFLNEVDMANELGADPYNIQGKQDYQRSVVLHYTVFNTGDGKRVAAGKTKTTFAATINSPKKIIDGAYKTVSSAISTKVIAAIKPKP